MNVLVTSQASSCLRWFCQGCDLRWDCLVESDKHCNFHNDQSHCSICLSACFIPWGVGRSRERHRNCLRGSEKTTPLGHGNTTTSALLILPFTLLSTLFPTAKLNCSKHAKKQSFVLSKAHARIPIPSTSQKTEMQCNCLHLNQSKYFKQPHLIVLVKLLSTNPGLKIPTKT